MLSVTESLGGILLDSNLTQTACYNSYLMLIKSDYFYYYSLYFNLALQ